MCRQVQVSYLYHYNYRRRRPEGGPPGEGQPHQDHHQRRVQGKVLRQHRLGRLQEHHQGNVATTKESKHWGIPLNLPRGLYHKTLRISFLWDKRKIKELFLRQCYKKFFS